MRECGVVTYLSDGKVMHLVVAGDPKHVPPARARSNLPIHIGDATTWAGKTTCRAETLNSTSKSVQAVHAYQVKRQQKAGHHHRNQTSPGVRSRRPARAHRGDKIPSRHHHCAAKGPARLARMAEALAVVRPLASAEQPAVADSHSRRCLDFACRLAAEEDYAGPQRRGETVLRERADPFGLILRERFRYLSHRNTRLISPVPTRRSFTALSGVIT